MADSKSSEIGLVSVLGLIFITLKLTDNIDWSWWWVLSPFWINGLIIGFILTIWGFLLLSKGIATKRVERRRLDEQYRQTLGGA